jgi:glycine/D-amino acid oxidase-like deaminating enzyme
VIANAGLSLWHASLPPEERIPRPALDRDLAVDVAIVGAGYTGLWTAYALLQVDPTLRVAICERETAGFGASGRNGGWCSSFFAGSRDATERIAGRDGVIAMQRAMYGAIADVEAVVAREQIDCDWAHGGTLDVATNVAHVRRLQHEITELRALGFGEDDYRWLDAAVARDAIGCTPNLGALFTPHCAAIHPAKLCRGLARVVERLGASIYERTPVTAIDRGRVHTRHGTVRADVIVRATEAFTVVLPGAQRALVPLHSLMIATEPLPAEFWASAGLAARQTFADARHMVIYGQRTADDRIAFGGRGAPYHFGSRIGPSFDVDRGVFRALHDTLRGLFPMLGDHAITHQWGGAVAVPRDWYPSVGFDRATGMAWAGGYVGDGVSTTNLAGRTLADLVLGRDSELVRLPWVGHHSPRWEPEPLRWLGVNAGRLLIGSIDRAEARGRRPTRRQRAFTRLFG